MRLSNIYALKKYLVKHLIKNERKKELKKIFVC